MHDVAILATGVLNMSANAGDAANRGDANRVQGPAGRLRNRMTNDLENHDSGKNDASRQP